MRLSTSHGFAFLNNVKCASTSVNKIITRYCDVTPNDPDVHRHMTARQMQRVLRARGIDRSELFIFTTIRNPWDRMVSQWFHSKRTKVSQFHTVANEVETLRDFVASDVVQHAYRDRHSYRAFCLGRDGEPLVDLVIRSEEIDARMPHLLRTLGIAAEHEVPSANRSQHAPYREYYDATARDLVADLLWDDIEIGAYVF